MYRGTGSCNHLNWIHELILSRQKRSYLKWMCDQFGQFLKFFNYIYCYFSGQINMKIYYINIVTPLHDEKVLENS